MACRVARASALNEGLIELEVAGNRADPEIGVDDTLLVAKKSSRDIAVASDPDRDLVWIVDLSLGLPLASIQLQEDDEPGRLVENARGSA